MNITVTNSTEGNCTVQNITLEAELDFNVNVFGPAATSISDFIPDSFGQFMNVPFMGSLGDSTDSTDKTGATGLGDLAKMHMGPMAGSGLPGMTGMGMTGLNGTGMTGTGMTGMDMTGIGMTGMGKDMLGV